MAEERSLRQEETEEFKDLEWGGDPSQYSYWGYMVEVQEFIYTSFWIGDQNMEKEMTRRKT